MKPVRLLVVDDHTLFRRGLIALLAGDSRFVVVAEAGDAGEAQRRAAEHQPDVILLDNHMPGVSGVMALAGLREVAPAAHVLMLTVSEDASDLAAALRGGARGYLLKTLDSDMLRAAILQTMAGESVVSPEMTSKLVHAFQASHSAPPPAAAAPLEAASLVAPSLPASTVLPALPAAAQAAAQPAAGLAAAALTAADTDPIHSLSPREREILDHIARGASNKEVARALAIAEATVKIHVQHILRKLKLSSRVHAAVYATRRSG